MRERQSKRVLGYLRRLETIVSPLCSRLSFCAGIDGRTAGPLIKFFKQNGCIVIHKCECHFDVEQFSAETEALTPRCSR